MGRTFVKKQLPVGSADGCKSQFVHQINFKLYKTEKVSKYPPFEKKLFSAILLSEGQRGGGGGGLVLSNEKITQLKGGLRLKNPYNQQKAGRKQPLRKNQIG